MTASERVAIKPSYMVKIALITLVIFGAGLSFGFLIDTARNDFLAREIAVANLESESFITGQLYLANHPDFCTLMSSRIAQLAETVEQLGKDLANIGGKQTFFNTTFLDRRYFLYEIRFWMAAEEYKSRCGKSLATILFFYDSDNDPSVEQGLVLTALKEKYGPKLLVFSLERKFDEPVIQLLAQDFSVTRSPTLIVNRRKIEGLLDKESLSAVIEKELGE
jgi:hypothetical protein